MSKYITVTPAYGRVLNSQKEVKEYYESGKDFRVLSVFASGTFLNKEDVERSDSGIKLEVRYGKNGKKAMII